MIERSFYITEEEEGERLDKYIASAAEELSRSYIQRLIRDGAVFVNHKPVKTSYIISAGDVISLKAPEPEPLEAEPEAIPLDILYEDTQLIVVNKPKGMVVHPAAGHKSGTLVNALLYHCGAELSGINGIMRPGIVHRIDKDTTGTLVVCKTDEAHAALAKQLKEHSITRKYRAIIHGVFKEDSGTIDAPIGRNPKDRKKMAVIPKESPASAKSAVTHWKVLERFQSYSYIECQLETGRTHQIRVHMASVGRPLLGDTVYGAPKCPVAGLIGQTLHAMTLGFLHPVTDKYMEFIAPLPEYFEELLKKL